MESGDNRLQQRLQPHVDDHYSQVDMLLHIKATLGNIPISVLLDTAASINLVGQKWLNKWNDKNSFLPLTRAECSVTGAHSQKNLEIMGIATLPLVIGPKACFPFTFLLSKDFEGEALVGYPQLRKLGATFEMLGILTTVKFRIFPDQIFSETPQSEICTLKTHEAFLVTPALKERKFEWLSIELRDKILNTTPYSLSDKNIHIINMHQIEQLNELIHTGIPTLVITIPSPKSTYYQFATS